MVLSIVAVALFLLIEGHMVAGLIVLLADIATAWLTGVWVIPRSIDAYSRKLSLIMREADTTSWYERDRQRKRLRTISSEMESLSPPQSKLDLHRRILANLHQLEDILDDKSLAFTDRATSIFEKGQTFRRFRAEFSDRCNEPYTRMATKMLDRYKLVINKGAERDRDFLGRLTTRIKKLRPPSVLAERHRDYLLALSEYVSATNSYYEAAKGDSIEAVRKAAMSVTVARSILDKESRDYAAEVQIRSYARTITADK